MKLSGKSPQIFILECRRHQRNPHREAIFEKSIGNSPGTKIQQIDKVGVIAEVRVQLHRFGFHFSDRIDGAAGRKQKHVDGAPQGSDYLLIHSQLIITFIGIHRGKARASFDDALRDRMQGVRLFGKKVLDRR